MDESSETGSFLCVSNEKICTGTHRYQKSYGIDYNQIFFWHHPTCSMADIQLDTGAHSICSGKFGSTEASTSNDGSLIPDWTENVLVAQISPNLEYHLALHLDIGGNTSSEAFLMSTWKDLAFYLGVGRQEIELLSDRLRWPESPTCHLLLMFRHLTLKNLLDVVVHKLDRVDVMIQIMPALQELEVFYQQGALKMDHASSVFGTSSGCNGVLGSNRLAIRECQLPSTSNQSATCSVISGGQVDSEAGTEKSPESVKKSFDLGGGITIPSVSSASTQQCLVKNSTSRVIMKDTSESSCAVVSEPNSTGRVPINLLVSSHGSQTSCRSPNLSFVSHRLRYDVRYSEGNSVASSPTRRVMSTENGPHGDAASSISTSGPELLITYYFSPEESAQLNPLVQKFLYNLRQHGSRFGIIVSVLDEAALFKCGDVIEFVEEKFSKANKIIIICTEAYKKCIDSRTISPNIATESAILNSNFKNLAMNSVSRTSSSSAAIKQQSQSFEPSSHLESNDPLAEAVRALYRFMSAEYRQNSARNWRFRPVVLSDVHRDSVPLILRNTIVHAWPRQHAQLCSLLFDDFESNSQN